MVGLIVVFTIVLLGLMASVFLLGFRLGGDYWQRELLQVRLEAAAAQRRLHDLTREAFVAMTEHARWRTER